MTTLRKALLGGAALAVMATGAQADELSALKAQLEALQSRVNTMEASASTYNLPEGTSLLTGRRGAAEYNFAYNHPAIDNEWRNSANTGYTIAVTPTADMPAPVAEITVSGYVSSWVVLGVDGYADGEAAEFNPYYWTDTGDAHLHINSRGAIRVRSKIDTAVGQVRTDIELRADAPDLAQMRYAWGEWDMTPNWTFGAGSFWQLTSLIGVPTTVNSSGALGAANTTRRDQVRLTYRDGPLSWAVALEEPTFESNTAMPDITTAIQYDLPGGHQLQVVAGVGDWGAAGTVNGTLNATPAQDELGWVIGAAAIANLADVATLSVSAAYGEGMVARNMVYMGGTTNTTLDAQGNPREMFGVVAGLGFTLNDTTTANIFGGYEEDLESVAGGGALPGDFSHAWVVGANIIWQPVQQLSFGWEVNYGEAELHGAPGATTADPGNVNGGNPVADTEALNLMFHTRFDF